VNQVLGCLLSIEIEMVVVLCSCRENKSAEHVRDSQHQQAAWPATPAQNENGNGHVNQQAVLPKALAFMKQQKHFLRERSVSAVKAG